ncbi:MAG: hypothetical protein R6V23_08730 [Bacteroidales bacterium]
MALKVNPEIVNAYQPCDKVDIDFNAGVVKVGDQEIEFAPLPDKLMKIIDKKGLVNAMKED